MAIVPLGRFARVGAEPAERTALQHIGSGCAVAEGGKIVTWEGAMTLNPGSIARACGDNLTGRKVILRPTSEAGQ